MSPLHIPKLFISYSHDSPEHQDRVRGLADRLRADGVDAWVDQYAPAPPEGWPMWMEEQIRNADFVVLVCTETYLRRVERREEPGKGRGVLWEVKTIYNLLYTQGNHTQRFIPVLFADGQPSWIPIPLQGLSHYQVDRPEGYEDLYRHVTNQPRYEIPVLGERKALPTIAPQSYPASLAAKLAAKTATSLDQRHRQQLLKQVHLDWIEGVGDGRIRRWWIGTLTTGQRNFVKGLSGVALLGFAGWCFQEFSQMRGWVNLLASRIILGLMGASIFGIVWIATASLRRKNIARTIGG